MEMQARKISGQYQEDVMAAAQALLEQQMAQTEGAQGPTGQAPPARPVSGPGFNPGMGGGPPAEASPEMMTREVSGNGNIAEI